MLSLPERFGVLRLWPTITRELRAVVIRLKEDKTMRTFRIEQATLLLLMSCVLASAQTRTFTRDDIEYALDLPSPAWQVISRLDVHDHFEFMYGADATNGYMRLRKMLVDPGTSAAELFQRDEKWELQQLPGYVLCSECNGREFKGKLSGSVFEYEYVSGGKPMHGQIYYLQLDKRTFYSLRFTVACDKLQAVRDQMDVIARSFRLK